MIVLINGPFGIGKTTTAEELVRLQPNAIHFDPELIGAFLRRLLGPLAAEEDYQDLPPWRSLFVALAGEVGATYGRDLIVPMCLWRRDYFAAITDGLRGQDPDLACFRLVASREEVTRRILGRPDAEGSHEWCLSHLDEGLAAANDPAFGIGIDTDGRTPRQVAEQIARHLPIPPLT
jgi:hypothetical protein